MSVSSERPKSVNKTQIVPLVANHYPIPDNPQQDRIMGRRDSSTIKFIARSMSMVPVPVPDEDEGADHAEITDHELNDNLEIIADIDMVYIRQIPQNIEEFINVPNKYQVENSSGDKLYDIIETTDALTRRLFGRNQPFTMKLLSNKGDYICEWDGDPGVGGRDAFVKVMRKSSLLGKIVQTKSSPLSCCIFSPVYNVLNMNEKVVYTIRLESKPGLTCCLRRTPAQFQVVSSKTSAKSRKGSKGGGGSDDAVASISKQQKLQQQDTETTTTCCLMDNGQEDAYSLDFYDVQMDRDERMLLFAAVILLDFQFFNGVERWHRCKLVAFCVIVAVVIAVVVGIVVYSVSAKSK